MIYPLSYGFSVIVHMVYAVGIYQEIAVNEMVVITNSLKVYAVKY